jgi:hypothetical protein
VCGECVGGNTNYVAEYNMDECGLCNGPGKIDWYEDSDGDYLGSGTGESFCANNIPDGYVTNANDQDPNCATNDTDVCGVCGAINCLSINEIILPDHFSITSIYPNPFNPVANITYTLAENTTVQIMVYNLLGRKVSSLVNEFQPQGNYSIRWNASSQSGGIYFIQMIAGNTINTRKLVLIK